MKLSPISVPYRAIQKVSGLLIVAVFLTTTGSFGAPIAIGLATLAVVAAMAYEFAYYRRFDYTLTDDTFDIRSGVISRREREIPYRRIQNVDLSRNVVQRLLGVAAVQMETAGGSSTEGSIRYVNVEEAKRLQSEIQRLKARRTESARSVGEPDEDVPEGTREPAPGTDEELLFAISPTELALVGALSFDPRLIGLLAFVASGSFPVLSQLLPELDALVLTVTGALLIVALLVASWVLGVVAAVTNYYGFRLSRTGDELRYERGLFRRYSGSIPLEKVQTLSITDNPLKRSLDYATLAIETAGYAPGQGGEYGSQAAIPLAKRDRVVSLAREIEAFGEPDFRRPPKRIRWRYAIRYAIALGVLVAGLFAVDRYVAVDLPWFYPAALTVLIPPAAHLKWIYRGYWLGEDHVVTRYGFWNRRTKVVPYYRIQTVIDTRTVFQRRWNVATVHVDTAGTGSLIGGGAAALDIDDRDAVDLRAELNDRLQTAVAEWRAEHDRFEFQWADVADPDRSDAAETGADPDPKGSGSSDPGTDGTESGVENGSKDEGTAGETDEPRHTDDGRSVTDDELNRSADDTNT